jgi:hypothetical protein
MKTKCKRTPKCPANGKIQHETKLHAEIHLHELQVSLAYRGGDVYQCPHCDAWHVGRRRFLFAKERRSAKRRLSNAWRQLASSSPYAFLYTRGR